MSERIDSDDFEVQISRYLDGQLGRRAVERFERRLSRDKDLQEQLRKYTALQDHLSAMGAAELEDVDYDAQRAQVVAALERRVLLKGLSRRRLLLRPALAVMAAAAGIVIVASVAMLVFRAPAPTAPDEITLARVLPAAEVQGDPQVDVEFDRLNWDQIRMAPAGGLSEQPMPAGTVLVAVGSADTDAAFIYPMWIE